MRSGLPPPWPNLGEGTNLRLIVLVRRAEPRAGLYKDGTWCDVQECQTEYCSFANWSSALGA
jgi:hypothetical protein